MKITHSDIKPPSQFEWTLIAYRNNNSNDDDDETKKEELVPRNRFHHAACSQGRFVYILGGKAGCLPLKDLWRLDTVTHEWKQIEDKETTIPHLQGHTMLSYKSQLLIFGGTFNDSTGETPLWIYNTDINHIRLYSCGSCSPKPTGRREHSAVIYKNSMYIYGGFTDDSGSTDEFWSFKIVEEEWRLIRRHKPGKRHGHISVVSGGCLWLHGGMKGLTPLNDLWTFNFAICTWNKIKGFGLSPTLSNHTAHVVKNSLVFVGGSSSGLLSNSVWLFGLNDRTWRQILMPERDVCPPISLHVSVLLDATDVEGNKIDQSKSMPQLKEKSQPSDDNIRPWTSPGPISSEHQPNQDSFLLSSTTYDILQLDTLTTDWDTNNNKSQENLFIESRHRETSFCSIKQEENYWSQTKNRESGAGRPSQARIESQAKIRSASVEHCDDGLPLLQRFQSVTSDTDLGENNLTLTLSDEIVFQEDEPFRSLGFSKKILGSSLERIHSSYAKPFTSDSNNQRLPSKKLLKGVKRMAPMSHEFVNPVYTELFKENLESYPVPTNMTLMSSMSKWNSSEGSCLHLPGQKLSDKENLPPKSRNNDDLIVEDLELSDMGQTLHNIKLAYPSTSSLKWSSLTNVSTVIMKEKICAVPNISQASTGERTKSCGNLTAVQSREIFSNKLYPSDLRQKKDCFEKCAAYESSSAEFTSTTTDAKAAGKYVKKQNLISSHHLKAKSHRSKLLERETQSIGTQTTGSHLSLQNLEVNNVPVAVESQFQHFMVNTGTGVDAAIHEDVVVPRASRKPYEHDLKGRNSILSDCQQCILVLGGQTDYPSFQSEPLEIWRCHHLSTSSLLITELYTSWKDNC